MWKNCFTLLVLLSTISIINAQNVSPTPTPPAEANINQVADPASRPAAELTTNPPPPREGTIEGGYLSSKEFAIAILITVVSLIALGMQFLLLKPMPKLKAEDSLRSFAIILILMGTLFMIAAGFDSIQIAPAMGLFGTIAGYLLGRADKKEVERNEQKN